MRLHHLVAWGVLSAVGCTLLAPGEDEVFESAGGAAGSSGAGSAGGGGKSASAGRGGLPAEGGEGGASSGTGGDGAAGAPPPNACDYASRLCTPPLMEMQEQACGLCNTGIQARSRMCSPDCTWGEWSEWSECGAVTAECEPGATQTETQACGPCNTGTQTRSRTCGTSDCVWGAFSGWGSCGDITAQCEPMHWYCCGTRSWMWCRDSTCQWTGDCDQTSCVNSPYCDCP